MKRLVLIICCSFFIHFAFAADFVSVKDSHFLYKERPYYFCGVNWNVTELLQSLSHKQKNKVIAEELNLMVRYGINDLRITVGMDTLDVSNREDRNVKSLIAGLDYLLKEASRRNMHIVFCVTINENSWEGNGDAVRHNLKSFVQHCNIYTKSTYNTDPSILAWELCLDPEVHNAFPTDISKLNAIVSYIRNLVPKQLLTVAGSHTLRNDETRFMQLFNNPQVDYVTINIMPSEYGWVSSDRIFEDLSNAYVQTSEYIDRISFWANKCRKPVVIDEFSYLRDRYRRIPFTSTYSRNGFYTFILNKIFQGKNSQNGLTGGFLSTWGGWHIPGDYRRENIISLLNREANLYPYYVYGNDSLTLGVIAQGIRTLNEK